MPYRPAFTQPVTPANNVVKRQPGAATALLHRIAIPTQPVHLGSLASGRTGEAMEATTPKMLV